MKRVVSIILFAALLVVFIYEYNDKNGREEHSFGTITVGGSAAAEKVTAVLLEAFTFENSDATISYSASNSMFGVGGVQNGILDLGVTSFLPEGLPEEIFSIPFARETIVVLVNEDNPVQSLSMEQLRAVAVGEITNWQQLGGNDEEIVFLGRKETSGTRSQFETTIGAYGQCRYDAVFSGSGAIANEVISNPAAIGYVSTMHFNDRAAAVTLDGVQASMENVRNKSYPIVQTYYLLVNQSKPISETTQQFLDFFYTVNSAELVEQTGAVYILR